MYRGKSKNNSHGIGSFIKIAIFCLVFISVMKTRPHVKEMAHSANQAKKRYKAISEEQKMKNQIAKRVLQNKVEEKDLMTRPRLGRFKFLLAKHKELTLPFVRKNTEADSSLMYWTPHGHPHPRAVSARDKHRTVYFGNGFLLGYKPFEVPQPWLVPYAIARRVKYARDDQQFGGDLWLTAADLWDLQKGDCEDHAIAMADWLIAMGFDARVVIGKTPDTGHAWVVVFEGEATYVLEATSKVDKRVPPRQEFVNDLFPKAMFNKEFFWFNSGGYTNLDYRSPKWIKTGQFVEAKDLKEEQHSAKPPVVSATLPRKKIPKKSHSFVILTETNVLARPNFRSPVLQTLPTGTVITPTSVQAVYVEIKLANGKRGYVFAQDLGPLSSYGQKGSNPR